jgi:UDP-N-acetylglucosamine 1-carboxyvinyltransferase
VGTVRAKGNKNAALPAIAAALLTDQDVVIANCPRIRDVQALLDIVAELGVKVHWQDADTVTLNAAQLGAAHLDAARCQKLRGSVLLAAPLLWRLKKLTLPFPGGDKIGRRRLDTHLLALVALGAKIDTGGAIEIAAPLGLHGAEIWLDEQSVTATENTLMAAVVATGKTVIYHAACEPHVQELTQLLQSMGADIEGVGTNRLTIHGVQSLRGGKITLGADYLEVASLLALSALTGGEVTIENSSPQHLPMILRQFRRLGLVAEIHGENLHAPRSQPLKVVPDFRGAIPTLDDAPWPGFPADLTSIAVVAATQVEGSVIIHEKMFESRLYFVDQLIDMGAKIVSCDPHRVVIIGRSQLHGAKISSPDIRAGMALLIAGLAAEGESEIHHIEQIDRGYEYIDARLRQLGAKIERV